MPCYVSELDSPSSDRASAVEHDDVQVMQRLLTAGADPNATDDAGRTGAYLVLSLFLFGVVFGVMARVCTLKGSLGLYHSMHMWCVLDAQA